MDRETFKTKMGWFIDRLARENVLRKAWAEVDRDNWVTLGIFNEWETQFIDLMKLLLDDSEWLEYWVYDLDMGKKAQASSVQSKGEDIPIKTLDNLYDLIRPGSSD